MGRSRPPHRQGEVDGRPRCVSRRLDQGRRLQERQEARLQPCPRAVSRLAARRRRRSGQVPRRRLETARRRGEMVRGGRHLLHPRSARRPRRPEQCGAHRPARSQRALVEAGQPAADGEALAGDRRTLQGEEGDRGVRRPQRADGGPRCPDDDDASGPALPARSGRSIRSGSSSSRTATRGSNASCR